jgi:subtilisin family serine protease
MKLEPSSKLDLRLNIVLSLNKQQLKKLYVTRPQDPLLEGIYFKKEESQPIASVSIEFIGGEKSFIDLSEKYGVHNIKISANIITAMIPLFNINAYSKEERVVFIQLGQSVSLILDDSVPIIGAERLHRLSSPIAGENTIIGVVDKLLDFYHPDFIDPSTGQTRIKSMWIQLPSSDDVTRRPVGWSYGVEYNEGEINMDLNSGSPYSIVKYRTGEASHGTHVAGIAISNGMAHRQNSPIPGEDCPNVYDGVTTKSKIIFVDPFPPDNPNGIPALERVVDGIEYIFTKAGTIPCVVNLSLAYYRGPHDGSDLQLRRIDTLLAENGRFVTIGSGNSNMRGKYKEGIVPVNGNQEFFFEVPGTTDNREFIEIWYRGNTEASIKIFLPDGSLLRTLMLGDIISISIPGTDITVDMAHARQALNGDNQIFISISTTGDNIIPGRWKLKLTSISREIKWSGYIDEYTNIKWVDPVSNHSTLSNFTTCKAAISVGNHLKNESRNIHETSGRGPTRDGRIKPELSAPGTNICSTRSVADRTIPNFYYFSESGTSMACAHVAGIVSLVYEQIGHDISYDNMKETLFRMADRTSLSSIEDQFAHGWGRARIARILPITSDLTDYQFD